MGERSNASLSMHRTIVVSSSVYVVGIFVMSVSVYLNRRARITSLVCFASSIGSWPRQKKLNDVFFIVPVTHITLENELGFLRASFRKTLTRVIMTNTTRFGTSVYQEVYGELASHVGAVSRVHESLLSLTGSFFFFLSFEVHWGHWHRAYRCLSSLSALNYHIWHVLKYFLLSIKRRCRHKSQIWKWF